jgi:hypothetical protein
MALITMRELSLCQTIITPLGAIYSLMCNREL